jgi:putative transposase
MRRKKHTAEQINAKLHEAEVLQSQGKSVGETIRQLDIRDMTYYNWRKEYCGLRVDPAKRLKELEQGNQQVREAIRSLATTPELTVDTDAILELDQKIREAARTPP